VVWSTATDQLIRMVLLWSFAGTAPKAGQATAIKPEAKTVCEKRFKEKDMGMPLFQIDTACRNGA
jgi:hypothetical protein